MTQEQPPAPVQAPGFPGAHLPPEPLPATRARNQIDTLPPLDVVPDDQLPLSPKTGEPVRPAFLVVSVVLSYLGSAAAAVGLLLAMWHAVSDYQHSAQLIEWVKPKQVSFLGLFLMVLVVAIGALVAGVIGVIGYCAWCGRGWTRWGGLVVVALSALSWLITPITAICMVFAAAAAALLWTPPVTRFFTTFAALRGRSAPRAPFRTEPVVYGTLPRFR